MTRRLALRRALLVLLGALVAVATAVGPSRLAAAVGLRDTSSPAGFLPEPTPVDVRSPNLVLTDLTQLAQHQPIPLAGGGTSPADTTLLVFSTIELDDLQITQPTGGSQLPFRLAITNPGQGDADGATIGGDGETAHLWGVLNSLNVCLSADELQTIINGYSSALGNLLGALLNLLGPIRNAGPCPSITALLPVLSLLLKAGVPLPKQIRAANLDIEVYALHVTAPDGSRSLHLPHGRVGITQ